MRHTIGITTVDKIDFGYVENHFPKNQGNDELDFIESLMPEGVFCHHIDSYTSKRERDGKIEIIKRFQGVFYYILNLGDEKIKRYTLPPIEVLKHARSYQAMFYGIDGRDAVNCYTIWFD